MLVILKRELKSYFTSPIAYVYMVFSLFIFGLYFTLINLFSLNGDYTYVISSLITVLLFTTPILTMRLLSEEKKNKTDQLLFTAPITKGDIVLGKFLAATSLFALTLIVTMIHPLLLLRLGEIPIGKIFATYIGYFLLGTTLIAIGLFISALCENQIVSAIVSVGLFLGLMFIDSIALIIPKQRMSSVSFVIILIAIACLLIYNAVRNIIIPSIVGFIGLVGVAATFVINPLVFDGLSTRILQWFSIFYRYDAFSRGLLDISAIIYYLSFILLFVFLTIQTLEKRSWN